MLYLLVIYFALSGLASTVVIAALMRSAQIMGNLEQNGLPSLSQSVYAYRMGQQTPVRRQMVRAR